jgi:hypothetical protein
VAALGAEFSAVVAPGALREGRDEQAVAGTVKSDAGLILDVVLCTSAVYGAAVLII